MSVQTEMTRISSAKAAIASAIANKGVSVPNGTKIDGMAALIASIENGGGSGGSSDLALLGSGTFTGSGTATQTITHGLGVVPKVMILSFSGGGSANIVFLNVTVRLDGTQIGKAAAYYGSKTTTIYVTNVTNSMSMSEWNAETAIINSPSSSVKFTPYKYTWQAFG